MSALQSQYLHEPAPGWDIGVTYVTLGSAGLSLLFAVIYFYEAWMSNGSLLYPNLHQITLSRHLLLKHTYGKSNWALLPHGVQDVDFVHAVQEAQHDGMWWGRAGDRTSLVSWGDKTLLVSWEGETLQVSHVGLPVEFWCGEGFVVDVGGQAVVDDVALQMFDGDPDIAACNV